MERKIILKDYMKSWAQYYKMNKRIALDHSKPSATFKCENCGLEWTWNGK